jgi:UDP-glucuronate decarboxylase
MIELAEKVIKMTNSKSKLVFRPLPKDDPVRRKPDISKAEKILNWQPKVPLDDGLKKTIEYFSSILKK